MIQHRIFSENTQGTDWFVGDIHGHHQLLMHTLDRVDFDHSVDRLFSVGDLIDRGPDSERCVELLNEPWFFATLGNHEQMLIQGLIDPIARKLHLRNGGRWIEDHTPSELEAIANTIRSNTSLAMTIDTQNGSIGVIHAEPPSDWSMLGDKLEWDRYTWPTEQYHAALTTRSKRIKGIDLTIHGHVNCNYIEKGINQLWIDTLLQSGRLTVISAEQAFERLSSPF